MDFYPVHKITYHTSIEIRAMFFDTKNLDLIWKLSFVLITREALQLISIIDTIYINNQRFGEQFAKIAPITRIAERRTFLAQLHYVTSGGTHCDIHGRNLSRFHERLDCSRVDPRLITTTGSTVCVYIVRNVQRHGDTTTIIVRYLIKIMSIALIFIPRRVQTLSFTSQGKHRNENVID